MCALCTLNARIKKRICFVRWRQCGNRNTRSRTMLLNVSWFLKLFQSVFTSSLATYYIHTVLNSLKLFCFYVKEVLSLSLLASPFPSLVHSPRLSLCPYLSAGHSLSLLFFHLSPLSIQPSQTLNTDISFRFSDEIVNDISFVCKIRKDKLLFAFESLCLLLRESNCDNK